MSFQDGMLIITGIVVVAFTAGFVYELLEDLIADLLKFIKGE